GGLPNPDVDRDDHPGGTAGAARPAGARGTAGHRRSPGPAAAGTPHAGAYRSGNADCQCSSPRRGVPGNSTFGINAFDRATSTRSSDPGVAFRQPPEATAAYHSE